MKNKILYDDINQQGIVYNISVFVFNSNRWHYCQMQPQQFRNKGSKLRIFNAKLIIQWF